MASYHIEWKKSAIKELRNLPKEVIPKIITVVGECRRIPFPMELGSSAAPNTLIAFESDRTELFTRLPRRQRSSKSFAWRTEKTFTVHDARQSPKSVPRVNIFQPES